MILGILLLLGAPSVAAAQDAPAKPDCRLHEIASLDMTTEPDGRFAVPATIEGKAGLMMVDTGSMYSVIGTSEAHDRNLEIKVPKVRLAYMGGVGVSQMAYVHQFQLGGLKADDLPLLVLSSNAFDANTMGFLGPDIMGRFDLELDFAAGKLRLFDPHHCPGMVVYWTRSPYAVVPMTADRAGHVVVPVTLDGKDLKAVLDTGASNSTITTGMARGLFGVDKTDPAMRRDIDVSVNGTEATALYRYPFKALVLDGVSIGQPSVDILEGKRFKVGEDEMLIGIKTLRRLHLYIAYGEQKVYMTPAEER
jgi:predicted aspartyl protease